MKVGDWVTRKPEKFTSEWIDFTNNNPSKAMKILLERRGDICFGDSRIWWESNYFNNSILETLKARLINGTV